MQAAAGSIKGTWTTMEPLSPANREEADRLSRLRESTPNLGGLAGQRDSSKSFGAPMLIRENRGGSAIGLISNGEMIGYPGVAVILIYVDPEARAGIAMEAFATYVDHVFEQGARLAHFEVLAFNKPVLRMLAKIGVPEQARLRDQVYAGGRFWDVAVFALELLLSRREALGPLLGARDDARFAGDRVPARGGHAGMFFAQTGVFISRLSIEFGFQFLVQQ